MKMKFFLLPMFVFAAIALGCNKEDEEPMEEEPCRHTYNGEVKAIIDRSCAYAGCHGGPDAGMFLPETSKDYTNFEGMQFDINSGEFNNRALVLKNMPDTMWTPDDRPQFLNDADLEILTCWMDSGFPEN